MSKWILLTGSLAVTRAEVCANVKDVYHTFQCCPSTSYDNNAAKGANATAAAAAMAAAMDEYFINTAGLATKSATLMLNELHVSSVNKVLTPSPPPPPGFTQMVTFGDSLVDRGNLFAATGAGGTTMGYDGGRHTNGPLFSEQLANKSLSVPLYNYAYAGARMNESVQIIAGDQDASYFGLVATTSFTIPSLVTQVTNYLAANVVDPDALYVLVAGANDMLGLAGVDPTDPTAVSAATAKLTADMTAYVQAAVSLTLAGAKNVIFSNMPDVSTTPFMDSTLTGLGITGALATNAKLGLSQSVADANNVLSASYLGFVKPTLKALGYNAPVIYDTGRVISTAAFANFANHGFDTTAPCLDVATGSVCADPNKHLFYDFVHPTTAAFSFIAADILTSTINTMPSAVEDTVTYTFTNTYLASPSSPPSVLASPPSPPRSPPSPPPISGFTKLVTFGDSLSDTGNMFAATGAGGPPLYYGGGHSNGPLWNEQLENNSLSVPLYNYAYAGARMKEPVEIIAGDPDNGYFGLVATSSFTIPSLVTQVTNYLASNVVDPDALYVLIAGGNDIIGLAGVDSNDASAVSAATEKLTADMTAYVGAVTSLTFAGAKNVIFANLPDVSLTPFMDYTLTELGITGALATNAKLGLSQSVAAANAGLTTSYNAVKPLLGNHPPVIYDVGRIVSTAAFANFTKHGFDTTTPCLDVATGSVCADPDAHVWYDLVHPTSAAFSFVAADILTSKINTMPSAVEDTVTYTFTNQFLAAPSPPPSGEQASGE